MSHQQYSVETLGFYYEHDKETDRIHARPVLRSGGDPEACKLTGSVQKLSVWRQHKPCVHRACAIARQPSRRVCFRIDIRRFAVLAPHQTSRVVLPVLARRSAALSAAPLTSSAVLCASALVSINSHPVLSSQKKGRGLLEAEDRTIDNHPRHAFCNRQLCYSAAESQQRGQPETTDTQFYTSGSNTYSPNNPSPVQQLSPWSSALSSHQPQCSTTLSSSSTNSPLQFLQPLTPSSTNGSEPSGSPFLTPQPLPYADSPQSPLYWCVTTYVPEECNWREYLDEIIDDVRAEIQSETDFNSQFNRSTNFDTSISRKRKLSSSTVSFAASPSSSDSETADVLLTSSNGKRAKKYSLNALSFEQIALRKKEQNRIAAQRYRSRRNQTLEEGRQEIAFLEKRNEDLQREAAALEEEIRDLKSMLVGDSDSTIAN